MWLKPPSPRPSLRIYALSRPRCTNCISIGPISVVVWCGTVQQTCTCTVKPGQYAMATASSKRRFSSIGSDGSCAVPTSRRCHLCQEAWSSFQPRSAKPVPYESAVPPVAMGAVSAFTLTKRCCANSASANSRRWDEPALRERVAVEHALAHIGHWQGRRARYRGLRKNLFDLRRCAVVHNLHVLARVMETSGAE